MSSPTNTSPPTHDTAALREKMEQSKLDEQIWANLEEIGYAE